MTDLAVLARVTRAGADVGEPEFLQQRADVTFVISDAEAVFDELLKVDAAPPHDAVDGNATFRTFDRVGIDAAGHLRFDEENQIYEAERVQQIGGE